MKSLSHFRQLAPVVWNQPPGTNPLWPIPVVHDVMWAAPPPPPSASSPPPTYASLMPVQLPTAPPTAPPPLQMSSAGEDFIVMALQQILASESVSKEEKKVAKTSAKTYGKSKRVRPRHAIRSILNTAVYSYKSIHRTIRKRIHCFFTISSAYWPSTECIRYITPRKC